MLVFLNFLVLVSKPKSLLIDWIQGVKQGIFIEGEGSLVDLLVLASSDQLLLIPLKYFYFCTKQALLMKSLP